MALDLSGVNVLCGKNYSGKTAVLTALRLGLCGYLPPPLGKLPGSIFKLAGNPDAEGSMSIELETDGNRTIKHKWARDSKGKMTTEGGVPMDLQMPALLADARQFFGMTAAQRINVIFSACDVSKSGFGPALLKGKLTGVQVSPARICEATLGEVERFIDAQFKSVPQIQDATERLVKWLKACQSDSKASGERASGSFAAFNNRPAGPRPVDHAQEISLLENEMTGATVGNEVERSRLFGDIERLKNQFASEFSILSNHSAKVTERVESLARDMKAQEANLKGLQAKKVIAVAPLEKSQEKLTTERDEATARAEAGRAAMKAENDLLASSKKLKLCAQCTKALAEAHAKSIGKLKAQITRDVKAMDSVSNELEAANKSNADREILIEEVERDLKETRETSESLSKLLASYEKAVTAFQALPKAVDNSAQRAKLAELKEQQNAFNQNKNDIKRRDELEQDVLKSQCEEAVYKAVVKIVLDEQEKVMAYAFNEVLAVAKHFTDGLLNSPLEFANGELGRRVSALDTKHGNTAPVGSWISHETMSTTETMLCYAGFSVALAQQAPMKIIFMDELAVIKSDLLVKVLERMCELFHKGTIDQFIGCMPEALIEAKHLPELKVIKL